MLKEIISNNSSLNKVFQNIQSNLENLGDIPQDFIQNTEDLVTATPGEKPSEKRPLPIFSREDFKSYEVVNISIEVLTSPAPPEKGKEISKQIGKLEKLWNFISQNNSDKK